MAKVTLKNQPHRTFGDNVPYGNTTTLAFTLKTNATGAALNSDTTAAIAAGDVIDLGVLPAGLRLDDASVLVATAMSASVTGSLGFAYDDGVDDATVPQDAAYFGSGLNINTAGRVRTSSAKLITLPKPARLTLTTAGAANAKASDLTVLVSGVVVGVL